MILMPNPSARLASISTPFTTASLGASFGDISTGFVNLGAQLFGPLFNSGENQRRVDAEVARTTQLLNRYEQTLLNAYREVEDALVVVRTYRAELQARQRRLKARPTCPGSVTRTG